MPSKREQLLEIMEGAAKGETKATLRARIAELEAENERLRRLVMAQSRVIHFPEAPSPTVWEDEDQRIAKALDAYRFYIDASEEELKERGIDRDRALAIAREIDPYDGANPTALTRPTKRAATEALEYHLAQLRHAYSHLKEGTVVDQETFANGLISPAIAAIETAISALQSIESTDMTVAHAVGEDGQEGQQDNEPVAWGVAYRGKIVAVSLHKGYHYTVPLYTRPVEQAVTEAEIQRLTTEIARKHGCDRGTFTVCWGKVEKGLPCRCEDEARHVLTTLGAQTPPEGAVTDEMVEAAQEAYRRVGKKHHWHPSWPGDDAIREILSAALTERTVTGAAFRHIVEAGYHLGFITAMDGVTDEIREVADKAKAALKAAMEAGR